MALATMERSLRRNKPAFPSTPQLAREQHVTVLFADIKGFTKHLEASGSQTLFRQLNDYLVTMAGIVESHGGRVLNQQGDGFMAVFGMSDSADHAAQACQSALAMEHAITWLNHGWKDDGLIPLTHGVGISSGSVMIGRFLADPTMGPTLIGPSVNLASRLQDKTRQMGHSTLISQSTIVELSQCRDKTKPIKTTLLGATRLKGFSKAESIYLLDSN